MHHRALPLLLAALFIIVPVAHADIPAPRLKPDRPNHSRFLDDHDALQLRRGLAAASDGEWREVRDIRQRISDPSARGLLLWRIANSDAGASFYDLDQALSNLQGWPLTSFIQREAEFKINTSGMSPLAIIDWFQNRPPQTGEGKIALGEALIGAGRRDEGAALIRDAWRNNALRAGRQSEILAAHRGLLTQDDHIERVDYLLWTDQRSSARALMSLLPAGHQRLTEARIRLAGRDGGVQAAVDAVPSALQSHPGFLYERARWRRRAGLDSGALEALLELPATHHRTAALEAMWTERRLAILNLIRDENWTPAYRLAAANGMSSGAAFADAEFLAGWIALTRLNRPEDALRHFTTLAEGVSFAVSVSRGRYWQGRAAAALGDMEAARAHYALAAEHASAFYGQLALAELEGENAMLWFEPDPVPSEEVRAAYEAQPEVRALRLLGELNESYYFSVFSFHLDDITENAEQSVILSQIGLDYLRPRESLRAAKDARNRGMMLPQMAYPVIDLPYGGGAGPDPALVHAVIRQETEFNPAAVSGAGARGLMQMMPGTAREAARAAGLPYDFDRLTADPEYNLRLGSVHLEKVVADYSGSYLLALVAYNAGPHRVRTWVANYGDPRDPHIDPVNWIESIPFSETRDYVMRVLENVQVYRMRLAGDQAVRLTIRRDLGH